MDIDKYLEYISGLPTKKENKRYEYDMWYETAKGTSGRIDGERVQSSGNQKKLENAVVKYTEIEKEIAAIEKEIGRFIEAIEKLPKKYYEIMHDLYIKGFSLNEIQSKYHKKKTWATTNHNEAKKELRKVLEKWNEGSL